MRDPWTTFVAMSQDEPYRVLAESHKGQTYGKFIRSLASSLSLHIIMHREQAVKDHPEAMRQWDEAR